MKKIALFIAFLFVIVFSKAQTYNATVAKDGSGTHTTIAAAIASAPTNSSSNYYIFVKSGVYYEKDTVPTNRPNIVMVGENVLNTILYYNDNANTLYNGSPIGTSGSAAFFVNGANFSAFNMTFQNNSGVAAGQSVAVNISGDKAAFRNCRFLGFQDVLYCKNAGISSYFRNCYIEGTVDFIFGASTSWFEGCYIYCKSRQSGGVICAPNTNAGTSFGAPWGFVFNNCNINGASSMTGLYFLGRPWQNKPQAVFLNNTMSDVIATAGWSSNSAGSATTSDVSFGEYNSSGTGANSSSRAAFSSQLTSTQALNYTTSNVFGSWDPCNISNMCNTADAPLATANFTGTQINSTSASFSWNMCWPLAMSYTLKRSNNGGTFTTIDNFNGAATNFNYTSVDNSMPTGVNKYILLMTNGGTTLTSTDTITISNQPTITSSSTSLSAYTQTLGSPSYSQGFTITGSNLTGNITVTAPANFQVSSDGSNWVSSYSITQSGGSVASTTVNVRLNASSNGSYSGNISLATNGGTTVNVGVSGTTSSAPAYVASILQQWPLTTSASDSSGVRAIGINAATQTSNNLYVSNNATSPAFAPYSGTFGLSFGPSTTSTSSGLWTTANNGPAGNLSRIHYLQFTISGNTGYSVRIDSLILASAFYNTSSSTRLAVVYSKSGFASDSSDITVGGTLAGSALGSTAYGGFTNPILLANQTGGPTNIYRLPLNGATGVSLTSGQTLTVRLYFSCSSTGTPRYGFLKNVQAKGSVTPPPPTVTQLTPTAQVSGGTVVIDGTNFSGVTTVSFGGVAASSFVVNSSTQITATVAGGASGNVSVTTASGTASIAGFTFQTPTTYYNVSGADVTNINNWGTNTDGSGSHPTDFTSSLQTFRIYNSGATMGGTWTVSGTNSKISVNSNSGVFNQTQTINGTVDVENDADLEVKTSTAPTLGTLYAGSTVGYSGNTNQTITAGNYYNLVLNGTGTRTFPSNVVGISNQFTTNTYTSANAGSIISFNGSSPQTIPAFSYDSLIINNSNGTSTLGNASIYSINKGLNVLQNFTIETGDNFQLMGNNGNAFSVASGKILTVKGTLDNQSSGTATWGSLSSSSSSSTAANADSARFVVNTGGTYKINAIVSNAYYIAASNFKTGSTLLISQGSPRLPAYIGGNVIWETSGNGSLVQQSTNTIGGNLTIKAGQINNGTGGTGRTLSVLGKLVVQGGEYDVNGNLTGTSGNQILTVYDSIVVSGGKLYTTTSPTGGTGIINAYGHINVTGGLFGSGTAAIGGGVVLGGSSHQDIRAAFQNNIGVTVNNSNGVTAYNDLSVTSLTLTNGVLNTGAYKLSSSGSVTRTNGWVMGTLQKTIASGSNIATTFDLGDASNYLPVNITFASVTAPGDLAVNFSSPISAVTNYATAPISCNSYVNKYWSLTGTNGLSFTSYNTTLNYLNSDLSGSANPNSLIAALYSNTWNTSSTTAGSNSNSINGLTALGSLVLANVYATVTPTLAISTSSATVCSGDNVAFNAIATNGGTSPIFQWKKNGNNVGSSSSINFIPGSLTTGDIISCVLTANNNCQTTPTANSNNIQLTVNTSPAIGVSSSAKAVICTLGGNTTVYNSNTTNGGVWVSNNPSVASVATIAGASGIVTANAAGTAIITYTKTSGNGCTSTASTNINVSPVATPAAINGTNNVCVGSTTALTTITTGGVWSSTNNRGTINTGGVYTGVNAGTGEVKYTVTNTDGCSAYTSTNITVNAIPGIPSIAYAPGTTNPQAGAPSGSFCVGKVFNVVGSPAGGSWSATGVTSVTGGGTVTINAVGTGSIKYTYTNTAGCYNSRTISGNGFSCAARGINNEQLAMSNDFTIFPNPAKSVVSVQVDKLMGNGKLFITDYLGKVIKEQSLSMGTNTIHIANLSKGFYFVSTITNDGKTTKKLVVE